MPLLLRGLDLPDFDIRANVIATLLAAAVGEKDKNQDGESSVVSEHANTLTTAMLKNSMIVHAPSVVSSLMSRNCSSFEHALEARSHSGSSLFSSIARHCAIRYTTSSEVTGDS
jgi:hypothetical protein